MKLNMIIIKLFLLFLLLTSEKSAGMNPNKEKSEKQDKNYLNMVGH